VVVVESLRGLVIPPSAPEPREPHRQPRVSPSAAPSRRGVVALVLLAWQLILLAAGVPAWLLISDEPASDSPVIGTLLTAGGAVAGGCAGLWGWARTPPARRLEGAPARRPSRL
jgi:hypothetical protein